MPRFWMIAGATDSHSPMDWPVDRILANRDEAGAECVDIEAFDSLDAARSAAVQHCAEWFASTVESIVEVGSADQDPDWAVAAAGEKLARMPKVLSDIARLEAGDYFVGVTSRGDWVGLEAVRNGD